MKKVAIGVDIGGTNTAIGVVDAEGNVIETPLELVDDWIATQANLASDGVAVQIVDATGATSSANVNTDAHGRNYRQLMQKSHWN